MAVISRPDRCLNAENGQSRRSINAAPYEPLDGDVSPDGRLFATALWRSMYDVGTESDVGAVVIFDLSTEKELHRIKCEDRHVNCVRFTKNGRSIVAGYQDGNVRQWSVHDGSLVKAVNCAKPVTKVILHPHERAFATVHSDATIVAWQSPE